MTANGLPWDTLAARFPTGIRTVDSHTAGEATRLVVGGLPPLPGETMSAKLAHFRTHHDAVRRRLTREPRGHRDLLAAVMTAPVEPDSHFGLIYMDAQRYPYLCGHATIGAVTTAIEAGWVTAQAPSAEIRVDTPSGTLRTRALVAEGRVTAVAIRMVPSFVFETGRTIDVPGFGALRVETVCVGGFFVMAAADQLPFEVTAAHSAKLIDLGMRVIDAANRQLTVRHPLRLEVDTIDVVKFYATDGRGEHVGRSAVVYGDHHLDRSPCGTGTAATLTLLHHEGRLAPRQPYVSVSPLGTRFEARILEEVATADIPGVVVEVQGAAHVTGLHTFLDAPGDPLPEGFLL